MPRCFTAAYTTYYRFKVPKGIFLLDEHEEKNDGKNPGSWWVKWGVFHYIDKTGKEVEIEGVENSEHKWPDILEEDDSEESDDEEEEEEEPLEGCEQPYPEVKEPLSTS